MLARLRLDGFVGGDHEQQNVNSRGASQHVTHKALVSRHVHKAEAHAMLFEEGKPQVNGDTAALLFFEAVGMRAGQRFDQCGFPVVDVSGGADNHTLGGRDLSHRRLRRARHCC